MIEYVWYDKCECGGYFEAIAGLVFDTYPSSNPVKCKKYNKQSQAHSLSSALSIGWAKPQWGYIF